MPFSLKLEVKLTAKRRRKRQGTVSNLFTLPSRIRTEQNTANG